MFDFHIHVNCSGGRDGLLPSEAMRLAKCAGSGAVGDRPGRSLDPAILLPTLKTLVKTCSLYADIEAFAGVELVHVPPALLPDAVGQAREQGAALILAHGESIPRQLADVVETGTNLAAINAGVDILAHPGLITVEDAQLAAEKGVLLELNTAPGTVSPTGISSAWQNASAANCCSTLTLPVQPTLNPPTSRRALRKAAALGAGLDAEGLSRLHVTERKLVQKLLRL